VLKIKEIAFSCYPVTDMARARTFYESVLGLTPTMVHGEAGGMQWTEYELGNGTLSLGSGVPDWQPTAQGCSMTLEVEDFARAIAHLKANQVKFKLEPFDTGVCQMAFLFDPDGNTIGVHQRKAGHH
jgi:predicted enzyme related to lactoylglutathione lyase